MSKTVRAKVNAAAQRALVQETGMGESRAGHTSARARKAQAKRDAKADATTHADTLPAEPAQGKPGAAKKANADSKARQYRTSPMIEVRTAHSVKGGARFDAFAEAIVSDELDRFMARLTRIEVHFSDTNAKKHGGDDKRCQIEVRPASQQPVSATAAAGTVEKALTIAVGKMKRLLAKRLDRQRSRKGGRSLSGDP
ncbi:MAG: HPF/RaiA family ribosome-associated protein [Planctomycetota bacterium]